MRRHPTGRSESAGGVTAQAALNRVAGNPVSVVVVDTANVRRRAARWLLGTTSLLGYSR